MKQKRIWELDFARGFAIIMMVWDHLMFDLKDLNSYFVNFYEVIHPLFNWLEDFAELYWNSTLRFYGHFFFVSVFLLVSGISFTFSKSNLSRSLKMMIVAGLITLVTYFIDRFGGLNAFIVMGIIHMFALTTFLTWFVRFILGKLSKFFEQRKLWFDTELIVFVLGVIIIGIGIQFEFWRIRYVQEINWQTLPGIIYGTNAFGADYFGIFPYWGMIMIGTVIGNLFYKNRVTLLPKAKVSNKNVVILAGHYSLWVFVFHQLVLYALIFAIGYMFGFHL